MVFLVLLSVISYVRLETSRHGGRDGVKHMESYHQVSESEAYNVVFDMT